MGALVEAETAEAEAIKAYDALMAAKEKEVETLNAQIEAKLTRKGELGVELAGGLNELEDTEVSLAEDQKFLAELETGCATKEKEWAEVCKTRQEELVALAETIKILNDDDALELFKKTLPSAASLLQLSESSQSLRRKALMAIREEKRREEKRREEKRREERRDEKRREEKRREEKRKKKKETFLQFDLLLFGSFPSFFDVVQKRHV